METNLPLRATFGEGARQFVRVYPTARPYISAQRQLGWSQRPIILRLSSPLSFPRVFPSSSFSLASAIFFLFFFLLHYRRFFLRFPSLREEFHFTTRWPRFSHFSTRFSPSFFPSISQFFPLPSLSLSLSLSSLSILYFISRRLSAERGQQSASTYEIIKLTSGIHQPT